jgi:hypothetical protein
MPPEFFRPAPVPGRVGPSWRRRNWLRLTAWLGDHPRLTLLGGLLLGGGVYFYGMRLNGFAHIAESTGRWRMEVFGGTFRVERSIELPDVFLSLREEKYDHVDAAVTSAGFMGGTAFREEFRTIASRPGARIRIVALDPRMGTPGHPHHAEFAAAAAAFGMEPWEFSARCWHSAAVLLHLQKIIGPALEIKLLDERLDSVPAPFFTEGRSVQLTRGDNPSVRLDILVPRPSEPDGVDSFAHPGLIVRNRPDNADVRRFSEAFTLSWNRAHPLDATLQAELLQSLTHEPNPPGNQP